MINADKDSPLFTIENIKNINWRNWKYSNSYITARYSNKSFIYFKKM